MTTNAYIASKRGDMKLSLASENALETLQRLYSQSPIGKSSIDKTPCKCRRCKGYRIVKSGFVLGRQRYLCKKCGCHFTTKGKQKPRNKKKKQEFAKDLYLEGLGLRSIGRLLGVSHVSIMEWLKQEARKHRWTLPARAEIIELDEMFYYIGSKKRRRVIWFAVCRQTGRILSYRTGCRSEQTGRKLYNSIAPIACNQYFTDHYEVYRNILPAEKHRATKAETYTVEGMNSQARHYLARFRRRTKCYSKSEYMVDVTVRLFMEKVNRMAA